MKKIMPMFCFIPAIAIMGCSTQYEFSHKSSYVNQPHLQIAPGLSGSKMTQDYYPIPANTEGEASKQPVSLVPPGSRIAEYSSKR